MINDAGFSSKWLEKYTYLLPSFEQKCTFRDFMKNALKLMLWTILLTTLLCAFAVILFTNIFFGLVSILILATWFIYWVLDEETMKDCRIDDASSERRFDTQGDQLKQMHCEILITNFNCTLSSNLIYDKEE